MFCDSGSSSWCRGRLCSVILALSFVVKGRLCSVICLFLLVSKTRYVFGSPLGVKCRVSSVIVALPFRVKV